MTVVKSVSMPTADTESLLEDRQNVKAPEIKARWKPFGHGKYLNGVGSGNSHTKMTTANHQHLTAHQHYEHCCQHFQNCVKTTDKSHVVLFPMD